MQRSQSDLVGMAFAGPDLQADFMNYKNAAIEEELGIDAKKLKVIKDVKAGWGDWAGPGAGGTTVVSTKILRQRDRLVAQIDAKANEDKSKRGDSKKPNVMLSDRRIKTAAKFKVEGREYRVKCCMCVGGGLLRERFLSSFLPWHHYLIYLLTLSLPLTPPHTLSLFSSLH